MYLIVHFFQDEEVLFQLDEENHPSMDKIQL